MQRVSESVRLEFCIEFTESAVLHLLGSGCDLLLFGLEVNLRFSESLLLELFNDSFIFPSNHIGEISYLSGLSEGFNSEHFEGLWHDHSLLLIVWVWDAFENLESLEGGSSSLGLVREHSPDDSPEHPGWGPEVLKVSPWVGVASLVQEFVESNVISEQRARVNELFAPDYNDFLTSE